MKSADAVMEQVRPARRYVVTCDFDVPARIWTSRRQRAVPTVLIMILVVVLLALVLALVGLAAVSMDLPRVPIETVTVDTVTIDTEPVPSVPIYTPRGVDLLNAP